MAHGVRLLHSGCPSPVLHASLQVERLVTPTPPPTAALDAAKVVPLPKVQARLRRCARLVAAADGSWRAVALARAALVTELQQQQ